MLPVHGQDVIRPYCDLSEGQRAQLYAFTRRHDPERFHDAGIMELCYHSAAFEHGASQFTVWRGEELVGAMGAVIREAKERGEIFITAVAIEPGHEDIFKPLLDRTFACMPPLDGVAVHMGIQPSKPDIETMAAAQGFVVGYDGLVMTYRGAEFALGAEPAWRVETVDEANCEPYRWVLDSAFRNSPNGATVDMEQIRELMAEISHPSLLGLAWLGDKPAAAFELAVQGEEGWIEAIAVSPELQGRGIGRRMLPVAIERLQAQGATTIKLLVMSTNEPAVRLYANNGFAVDYVTSRWWRLATSS
ncbi:MAG: GCN5-related N-acetyltransferase [Cyanobacteria bacterium RYN_339]|nr:GCN5-related N-acetyltransferase [Cyanobacteria bacterium RYN_339]